MAMQRIKIIGVPTGEAPQDIREAWVGLVLPTLGASEPSGMEAGVLGGEASPENLGGYHVLAGDAVEALRHAGKGEAANWWDDLLFEDEALIFGKQFCELV